MGAFAGIIVVFSSPALGSPTTITRLAVAAIPGHPGMDVSGLEEEFDLSGMLPRLLYVKAPARIKQQAGYRSFRTPA